MEHKTNRLVFGGVAVLLVGGFLMSRGATPPPASLGQTSGAPEVVDSQANAILPADTTVAPSPEASLESQSAKEVAVKEISVDGKNFSFSPSEIRVKKGDKVKITFADKEGFHDLVVDGYNAKTTRIRAGATASVEFIADKVGTFAFYCSVGDHRAEGMEGKFIVE